MTGPLEGRGCEPVAVALEANGKAVFGELREGKEVASAALGQLAPEDALSVESCGGLGGRLAGEDQDHGARRPWGA